MLAYWHIANSTEDVRALSVASATYTDLLSTLMVSRGKHPRSVGERRLTTRSAPVKVYGGDLTPAIEAAANRWAMVNRPKHMAKKTGSSPEAIAWLLGGDV